MASTLIYHQFDDPTHGITVEKMDDGQFRFTVYEGAVQTHHTLLSVEAVDLMAAIDNNPPDDD